MGEAVRWVNARAPVRAPPRGRLLLCPWRSGRQIPPVPSNEPIPRHATAGLAAEWTRAGLWLFRWRSYTPLVLLGVLAAAVALDPVPAGGARTRPLWVGGGMALGLLGMAVRAWTVGMVPKGTSGRGTDRPGASALNTVGAY